MKKVLVIEGRKTIGGGQVVTRNICSCLNDRFIIELFLPGNAKAPLSKYLKDYPQYYYIAIPYNKGKKSFVDYLRFICNAYFYIKSLIKCLMTIKPDVLYVQHTSILPFTVLVDLFFKIPIVVHIHVVYSDTIVRWFVNCLLRNYNVKKIIGVSHYALRQISKSNKDKSIVIYNAVKRREKVMHHYMSRRIAIIGDVFPIKGHHILFEAVSHSTIDFEIHVIGRVVDEDYRQRLKNEYPKVKSIFTGMLSDVEQYIVKNQIDITVIASFTSETFSLAMVESWAQGVPTIASNDFGMKELVENCLPDYYNYMLFKTNDSVDLLEKLVYLENNEETYKQISISVMNISEILFDISIFKQEIIKVIKSII